MTIVAPIGEGEVRLACAPDDLDDDGLLAIYRSLLTREEWFRHDQYRFEEDRRRYLIVRALVRWMLAKYTGIDPRHFTFGTNAFGKPELTSPVGLPLCFNASKTRGMVACAVALGADVGVDVEDTTRAANWFAIAQRFFSIAEIEELQLLPEQRRHSRFFDYWTLKEAYVKARGVGMSLPFAKFTIMLDGMSGPTVIAEHEIDDGARWHLWLAPGSSRHRVAMVSRFIEGVPFRPIADQVIPFSDR